MNQVLKIAGGIVLGFFLLLVGCAALLSVGSEQDGDQPSEEGGAANDEGVVEKRASVGERLTLKGTSYRVTSVRTAKRVGDEFTGATAGGRFIIVKLQLTNEKDEPATISESAIRVVGGNGKRYSQSSDAMLAFEGSFVLEEIQPEVTKKTTLATTCPSGQCPART